MNHRLDMTLTAVCQASVNSEELSVETCVVGVTHRQPRTTVGREN